MLLGARVFVIVVGLVLIASFLATTGVLVYEFWDAGWFDFLTTDSHLFIFFPTFGLVALFAFYFPSCVFVDMYWRHVRFGPARFVFIAVVLAALSYLIAANLTASQNRSIWEIAPATLLQDKGEPSGCSRGARPCNRMPLLEALHNLREVSQSRIGLAEFVRDCQGDPLMEPSPATRLKRFCLASTPLSASPPLQSDEECCAAQRRFVSAVRAYQGNEASRSLMSRAHVLLLPPKVFFLLVLLVIGAFVTFHYKEIERYYGDKVGRIELGLLVGSAAVLFFPLMSQAFLQSVEALVGKMGRGTFSLIVPLLSLAFGAWLLLIILFFYRRRSRDAELLGKIGGGAAAVVAILKYDFLASFLVRALGSGASAIAIAVLCAVSIAAGFAIFWPIASDYRQIPPSEGME